MPVATFQTLSPAQARALGRLGKMKSRPSKFIIGFVPGEDTIIVVPPSTKDRRRWDISKGGRIVRTTR